MTFTLQRTQVDLWSHDTETLLVSLHFRRLSAPGTPKLKCKTLWISWVCQILECQDPLHKRKASLLKNFWWRFRALRPSHPTRLSLNMPDFQNFYLDITQASPNNPLCSPPRTTHRLLKPDIRLYLTPCSTLAFPPLVLYTLRRYNQGRIQRGCDRLPKT